MEKRRWIEICLQFADAYEDYPFDLDPNAADAWTLARHRDNKKTFAFIYERGGLCINLKCDPDESEFLRKIYPSITPEYHMNKRHWITVRPGEIPEDVTRALIGKSYELTK